MQGIFVNGRRPKSKKAVAAAVETRQNVVIEALDLIGSFSGNIRNMPENEEVHFVGPEPRTTRNFYGSIRWRGGKLVVV